MARSSALLRAAKGLRRKVEAVARREQEIRDSEAASDYCFAISEGWDLDDRRRARANEWARRNGQPEILR